MYKIGDAMLIYVVKANDTLYQIANHYHLSWEKIAQDNQIENPNQLVTGQTLVLTYPGEQFYERPLGKLWVNGYLYPYINPQVLENAMPSLTSFTIFGYGFREDGSLIPPKNDEVLIQRGIQNNVLSIFLLSSIEEDGGFSSEKASMLFQDSNLQQAVLTNILQVMLEKGYRGLDLDFEYIKREDTDGYIEFIKSAVSKLRPFGFFVNVDLAPKTSREQKGLLYEAHDYQRIGMAADTVLLMTYEWGYTYGPPMAVAPIDNVRRVVEYAITEIDRRKIFMGIPNYGYDWALPYERGKTKAETIGNQEAITLAARVGAEISFDPIAMSPYFYYIDQDGVQHVVWFEDARSIQAKLLLAYEYQLLGVGYWNLMRAFPQNWLVLNGLFSVVKL